jgi:hypothetical protein
MTRTETAARNVWDSTLYGKPAVGAVAQRSRSTSMQDVEMFSGRMAIREGGEGRRTDHRQCRDHRRAR